MRRELGQDLFGQITHAYRACRQALHALAPFRRGVLGCVRAALGHEDDQPPLVGDLLYQRHRGCDRWQARIQCLSAACTTLRLRPGIEAQGPAALLLGGSTQ